MAELLNLTISRIVYPGTAPNSIELGSFYGYVIYIRSYAASIINIAAIHTGRSDMVSADIHIQDNQLVFKNTDSDATYWGGLNILLIGSNKI